MRFLRPIKSFCWTTWKTISENYRWAVIGALWVGTYILACVGSYKEFIANDDPRSAFDPFYRPFQLFLLDDTMVVMGPIHTWEFTVARLLAPAVAGDTAFWALVGLFHEKIQLFRLRFYNRPRLPRRRCPWTGLHPHLAGETQAHRHTDRRTDG